MGSRLDKFVRKRQAVKADRATEHGVAGWQAAMAILGKGTKEPGDAPRNFVHSGDGKSFYAQGKNIPIKQDGESSFDPYENLRPGQSIFD
jgi:hypothetical protein